MRKAERSGSFVPITELYIWVDIWAILSYSSWLRNLTVEFEFLFTKSWAQGAARSTLLRVQVPLALHLVDITPGWVSVSVSTESWLTPNQMLELSTRLGPSHFTALALHPER